MMKLLKKLTKLVNTVNGTLYEEMRKELVERASWMNVKVRYGLKDFSVLHVQGYTHSKDVELNIIVKIGLSTLEEVVDIAHEMGHVWQFYTECNGDVLDWQVYREMTHVMLIEEDAWLRSVRLLHEVGFESWKAFRMLAIRKFATYVHVSIDNDDARRARVVEFAEHLDQEVIKLMREPIYA